MGEERARLLERIKRVQALAERGEAGERENAAALLEKLMKQHGITEAELAEERRDRVWFRFKTQIEAKLLTQVIYSVVGDDREKWDKRNKNTHRPYKQIGVDCTQAERLEIEASYEFFKAALEVEEERFFHAFVVRNHIFPSSDKVTQTDSEEEPSAAEMFKLQMMMSGMDEHKRITALESGAGT
jgi:hypothetical protein